MARGLAGAGASIAVAGRDAGKNAAAVAELAALGVRAEAFAFDATDEASCRNMVARVADAFGRLDILVNNAGTTVRRMPQDLAIADWRMVLDTNLTSAMICAQAAYPHFRRIGAGKVINIGSMMSIFGAGYAAAYAASKGGIVQLTRALAVGWAAEGIQVNAILPGWIDTELTRGARREVDGLHERVLARTPAKRWGTPDDLAGIAVFLASPASDFITGTAIPVDGGYSVQA
jgi:2-deoxy-D-gluconate 3-dehydrogenase